MSNSESAPVAKEKDQHDRTLLRRVSKSKLSKQAEVVDTDGPFGVHNNNSQAIPEVRTPVRVKFFVYRQMRSCLDEEAISF